MSFTAFISHATCSLSGFFKSSVRTPKQGSLPMRVQCARSGPQKSAHEHCIPPLSPWASYADQDSTHGRPRRQTFERTARGLQRVRHPGLDTTNMRPDTTNMRPDTDTHARQGKEMHGEATAPIPLTQRKATDATDPAQNEAMHEKPE